jgi:hypothetical protein
MYADSGLSGILTSFCSTLDYAQRGNKYGAPRSQEMPGNGLLGHPPPLLQPFEQPPSRNVTWGTNEPFINPVR